MIVLDTHALIWLDQGSQRLGSQARCLADEALGQGALWVSAITFWEVAMLVARGRIALSAAIEEWKKQLLSAGLRETPLTGDIAICAVQLAGFHPDPADRFITATAQNLDAILVTADQKILDWPGELRRHHAGT